MGGCGARGALLQQSLVEWKSRCTEIWDASQIYRRLQGMFLAQWLLVSRFEPIPVKVYKRLLITMENIWKQKAFSMGKSTISIYKWQCSIAFCMFTRGECWYNNAINHPPFKHFIIRWDSNHSQSWGGKHGIVPHYYRYSLKLGVRRSDLSAGLRMMMLESTHWLGMLGVGFHWGIQKIWWVVLKHVFHILGIIIPTDFHIFQRDWNHQPGFHWGIHYGLTMVNRNDDYDCVLQWGQDACLL